MTRTAGPILLALLLATLLATASLADEKHSLIVYTVFFDEQSATLAPDDLKVLGMMGDLIKDDDSYEVRVVAYTDKVDEDEDDEDLAKSRAKAVRDYLTARGVDKDEIDVKGKGDEENFGRDESATDRALRRRAEVRIRQKGRDKRSIDEDLDKDEETAVQTTVFFDFDKSDIKPEYEGVLRKLGVMLGNNPHYRVRVFGHTDGVGNPAYNLNLGNTRCDAVMARLKLAGATDNAVQKVSMGEAETVGSQSMEATTSRALSRSVEIKVIEEDD